MSNYVSGDYHRSFHRFVTRPDIDAPVWHIKRYKENATLAPGYWFLAFYKGLLQDTPGPDWLGPHIYDMNGELIWSGGSAFKHWNVFDFGVSDIQGEQKLTLLSNYEQKAYILDKHYRVERTVPLVIEDEPEPNMHTFNVIDGGRRALILNTRPRNTTKEVSAQVGFDQPCFAKYEGFREVALETQYCEPIFEWNAQEWIGLDETTYMKYDGSIEAECTNGWDILHLNSIAKFPDGDYILSARHTDTIYKISHTDGHVVWRLGGRKSDFRLLGHSRFSRQHHAQVQSQNRTHVILSLFDNALGDGPFAVGTFNYSRGLILSLQMLDMTARVLKEYPHPNAHQVNARGSFQVLPNGNGFACWAYASRISEHAADGRTLMQATLEVDADSYRAFKYPWLGLPTRSPDLHTQTVWAKNDIITIIHVSWNGATEVCEWVFKTLHDGHPSEIGSTRRQGFETRFVYHGYADHVFAEAFDKDQNLLGKSNVQRTASPTDSGMESLLQDSRDYLHESLVAFNMESTKEVIKQHAE